MDRGNDRLSALVRRYLCAWFDTPTRHARRQRSLAATVGLSEKHLSQIMRGRVGVTVEMADRLLAATGNRLVLGVEPIPSDGEGQTP